MSRVATAALCAPMLAFWLVAGLAPLGCFRPPPDQRLGESDVWWSGLPPLPHADAAIDTAIAHCHAECPALASTWRPQVHFIGIPFLCPGSNEVVSGCQVSDTEVWIGYKFPISQTAICDELEHVAWEQCHGGPGEADDGGGIYYQIDFAAAVGRCRSDMVRFDHFDDGGAEP